MSVFLGGVSIGFVAGLAIGALAVLLYTASRIAPK